MRPSLGIPIPNPGPDVAGALETKQWNGMTTLVAVGSSGVGIRLQRQRTTSEATQLLKMVLVVRYDNRSAQQMMVLGLASYSRNKGMRVRDNAILSAMQDAFVILSASAAAPGICDPWTREGKQHGEQISSAVSSSHIDDICYGCMSMA